MKSKVFMAVNLWASVLFCLPSANGQTQLPTPRRPTPDDEKPKPTGTATGGSEEYHHQQTDDLYPKRNRHYQYQRAVSFLRS